MLTNGPLVRYYVHISVPLPQHKCFDLVRYFFRVPPCPPLRPGFFLSQVRIPYLVETTLCHGKGTVILVFFGEEPWFFSFGKKKDETGILTNGPLVRYYIRRNPKELHVLYKEIRLHPFPYYRRISRLKRLSRALRRFYIHENENFNSKVEVQTVHHNCAYILHSWYTFQPFWTAITRQLKIYKDNLHTTQQNDTT